jgi:hypothetical protein
VFTKYHNHLFYEHMYDFVVVTGKTKVCINCFDWKDEGTHFERNINIDHGGSLLYAPVQLFLSADRGVNNSINELMHAPLGNNTHRFFFSSKMLQYFCPYNLCLYSIYAHIIFECTLYCAWSNHQV